MADLEEDEQVELLEEARTGHMGTRDLTNLKRDRKRSRTIEGQAALDGMFRVIYADPPWSYNNSGVINASDGYGRAARHYPSMTIEALCKLPVAAHAMPDVVLNSVGDGADAPREPGTAGGHRGVGLHAEDGASSGDKVLHNFGHYVSVRHEHLIICTRGSSTPDVLTPMVDSVQTVRRSDVDSEKPEDFRRIIERLYTRGPYLELFGRKPVEGWTVFGNDARLWPQRGPQPVTGTR